jgi:hypothetical protein
MPGWTRSSTSSSPVMGSSQASRLTSLSKSISNDPCKGAVRRVHSHFFTEDGEFGSRDWKGEDVDFGRYRVMGDRLVISKEFPDVTFRFSVEGDTLTLDPLNIPAGCTEFRCAWAVAVASPGEKWKRVG